DNGEYTGFDIDLLGAIAEQLDLELSVQDVGFDALQSGTTLAAGQCDIGASAMTITDERKANIDFSDPYYDSLQSLLVRTDSGIKSIDDLDGKNVGVQQGTTG
ncbi:transporter substrate-binding domain-containing protein, partial [Mycobacterium tuberculosis]|uniref:transporter substrate-binding domain-containing protein n=2 Tax=Actinomycetes TaxID=1760 RepID=UPI000A7AD429